MMYNPTTQIIRPSPCFKRDKMPLFLAVLNVNKKGTFWIIPQESSRCTICESYALLVSTQNVFLHEGHDRPHKNG
jgi:hypothetical protein